MDYPIWYWLIFIVIDVALAYWCGLYAQRKGYSRVLFSILGFLFFIITVLVLVILPDKRRG
jgi:hypothetical protein